MENEPFQILLADDDEGDRLLFKEALEELEIKPIVHTVNNGMELMDYLTKKNASLPHLIFLDLNMPRKNGLECLKEIRSRYGNKIAIAIFSSSTHENDIDETFRSGANVYIHKPNDFNELRQVLNKVVITAHTYQNTFFNKADFKLRV